MNDTQLQIDFSKVQVLDRAGGFTLLKIADEYLGNYSIEDEDADLTPEYMVKLRERVKSEPSYSLEEVRKRLFNNCKE